jgi:hypothetical protein
MSTGKAAGLRNKYGWDKIIGKESDWSYGMQIAFLCGDMQAANEYANKLKSVAVRVKKKRLPWYFGQVRVFYFALIAVSNARETGKRKYIQEAKKYEAQIREWVHTEGSINMPQKLQLLEAELASVKPNIFSCTARQTPTVHSLQVLYDKAIASSRRAGFLQDAALAALLASKAVDVGDDRYFRMGMEMLESWGASAVAAHYEKGCPKLAVELGQSSSTLNSRGSGYRSRSRFIAGIQKDQLDFSLSVSVFDEGKLAKDFE